MTVTNRLLKKLPSDNRFVMDWDDNVATSLLFAHSFLVLVQLILLIYIVLSHFQPCTIYRQHLNESYRRRYGNFIFRRLLAQLDRAFGQRPYAGEELTSCLEAKRIAQLAIRIFCRDSTKVLYPEYDLDSMAATDAYFVLDDEETELNAAGYASVNFDVTDAFLESLLCPSRADIPIRLALHSLLPVRPYQEVRT